MVGISTCANRREGLIIHKGMKNSDNQPIEVVTSMFLDRQECNHIYNAIRKARKEYWKKEDK